MSDSRDTKRVRQACLNCRRKKVRCSGERPVCAFCARLGQQCTWDDTQVGSGWRTSIHSGIADSDLAARVALLESQLSVLNDDGISTILQNRAVSSGSRGNESYRTGSLPGTETAAISSSRTASSRTPTATGDKRTPSLDDSDLVQSLVNTYFIHCQNQPYCYFHEASFRFRLEKGTLPEFLIYAVLATAVRFSDHEFFQGRQGHYIDSYSEASWRQILHDSFSFEDVLDLPMVQAMSMLAALDFTAGHQRLGWVKIGLSVRFAQGLRLYQEPSRQLRPSEQEEMRRTFWSIYVMDRLVSTGPHRPPTFVDEDITVQLPCHEQLFEDDLPCGNAPTLSDLEDRPDHSYSYSLDNFALAVLMASSLGQIIRYSMKKDSSRSIPPWDYRSQYSKIYSSLLYFESYSIGTSTEITEVIQHHFTINGTVDQHRTGHFIFSRIMYHLNQSLLNHPFLLHQRFVACRAAIPLNFVTEALRRAREHANELTELLHESRRAGCLVETSWYGYCALATGVIHRLFQHHDDLKVATESKKRLQMNLEFLEQQPARWSTYTRMAASLRSFQPQIPTAKILVTASLLAQKSPIHDDNSIWCLIDYGWLSDASKDHTTPHIPPSDPFDLGTLDIADETINPALLSHKEPTVSSGGNEMKNILGDDMGGLFSELLSFEEQLPD